MTTRSTPKEKTASKGDAPTPGPTQPDKRPREIRTPEKTRDEGTPTPGPAQPHPHPVPVGPPGTQDPPLPGPRDPIPPVGPAGEQELPPRDPPPAPVIAGKK